MDCVIRPETPQDYNAINQVIIAAFKNVPYSDQSEHLMVKRIRFSPSYIPALARVAVVANQVVGHILISEAQLISNESPIDILALAPVSVHPEYQKKCIGTKLILDAHEVAKNLKYSAIVLIGHADYYPRFGYEQADRYSINFPFDVPTENRMVFIINREVFPAQGGMVRYDQSLG